MGGDRRAHRLAVAGDDVADAGGEDLGDVLASLRAVSGVFSEGFITTVLPAASAGAIFQAIIIRG